VGKGERGKGQGAREMNIERPTSNVEWEKMKKQTYGLEERLLEYSAEILLQDLDRCVCLEILDLEISGVRVTVTGFPPSRE
jgi:hypothetical protein